MARYVSPNGYSDDYGPNVALILKHGTRTITGKVPAAVRRELALAVKEKVLCRFAKDGLKPEVYYHPQRRASAVRIRETAAIHSLECITRVCAPSRPDFHLSADIWSASRLGDPGRTFPTNHRSE